MTRTVQTGECWALNDGTALNRPLPGQQPTSTTLRDRVRDGRPTNPTAVEGHSRDVLQPRTRTGRQGRAPAGTSSARPPPGAKERRRRTTNGQGGWGQDRQRAPSSSSPAWHPISRVGWAFACVLPAPPPLLPRRDSSALSPMWTAAVAGPVGPHATAPAGYLDPRSPGLLAPCVRGFARRYHLNRWAAHIRQRACASLTLCTR